MRIVRGWWWIPCAAVFAVTLKAALLTPWIADMAKDGSTTALEEEGLDDVEFVGVDGVDGFGGAGLNVILQGPAADRSAAIAAVQARDEVDRVIYRSVASTGGGS